MNRSLLFKLGAIALLILLLLIPLLMINGLIADRHLVAAYDDYVALDTLGSGCAAVTTEFENVPADSLRCLAAHCAGQPRSKPMNLNLFQLRSLKTRITLCTLLIFVVSIWSLALYISRGLHDDMQRLLGEQQLATASLIADDINQQLTDRLDALAARYGEPKPLSVFYQLWYPPLTSVNNSTWPGQAITLCGGRNIMAKTGAAYPQVGLEQVIKGNPGLILAGGRDPSVLDHWRQWPMLDAVKHQRLALINADELHRFTPRALNAVEQICEAIEDAHTGQGAD